MCTVPALAASCPNRDLSEDPQEISVRATMTDCFPEGRPGPSFRRGEGREEELDNVSEHTWRTHTEESRDSRPAEAGGGDTGMSAEDNVRVIDGLVEAFNARNWDRVAKLHAESVTGWSPDRSEPRKGRAAIREEFVAYATAFPDSRLRKERAFSQGDWACGEFTFTGTHKGPLPGPGGVMVAATNRPLRLTYAVVFKLEGGAITERHEYFDLSGMMAQLGLAPQ